MSNHRPTRDEVVKYVAAVIRREGPLSEERQIEVLLEAFNTLKVPKEEEEKQELKYH